MLNRTSLNRTSLQPAALPQSFASGMDESPPLTGSRADRKSFFRTLRLPSSLQGYLFFLTCLLILAFTMVLHVLLSAEIMRLDVKLESMREAHARIERRNAGILWEVSQYSTLSEVYEKAKKLGFEPVTNIEFVPAIAVGGEDPDTLFEPAFAPLPSSQLDGGGSSSNPIFTDPFTGQPADDSAEPGGESLPRAEVPWYSALRGTGIRDALAETADWVRNRIQFAWGNPVGP
jgi:hypothetical protein